MFLVNFTTLYLPKFIYYIIINYTKKKMIRKNSFKSKRKKETLSPNKIPAERVEKLK